MRGGQTTQMNAKCRGDSIASAGRRFQKLVEQPQKLRKHLRYGVGPNQRLQGMPMATFSWHPQNSYLLLTKVRMNVIPLRERAAEAGLWEETPRRPHREGGVNCETN